MFYSDIVSKVNHSFMTCITLVFLGDLLYAS